MTIPEQIIAKIETYDTIIIHRHVNPDPDAIGSQVGLAEVLRNSYPDKTVYQVGSDTGNLAWLANVQEIEPATYQGALVIVTDTANSPRISGETFNLGAELIKIDHHPNDDPYGDLNWVLPDASSTSEIIIDIVNNSEGHLQFNQAAARVLYAGIVGDTGRFMFNSTSPHTMECAAQMMTFDIHHDKLNQKMNEITLEQAKLQGYLFDQLQVNDQQVAYLVVDRATQARLHVEPQQVHSIVGTPGRLKGVLTWVIFVQQADDTYRVHFRSKGPIINELAKQHDGGGHPLASGAKAADQAEIDTIIAELSALAAQYTE